MLFLRKKSPFKAVETTAGRYFIPDASALADDEQLCVQLSAPAAPDFDGLATELVARAKSYAVFHYTGVGQFSHRLLFECERYISQIDECADRLKTELGTTYKASIEAAIKICEARLAAIIPVETAQESQEEQEVNEK